MPPEPRPATAETKIAAEATAGSGCAESGGPRPSTEPSGAGPPTEPWRTAVDVATPRPEVAPPVLPDRVGRYEILAILGVGGMGKVFKAWDPELNRVVAVKLMRAHGDAANATEVMYFQREGRALAQVRHPHIVQIFDAHLHEDPPYLVMECLPGRSVQDRREYYQQHRREAVVLIEKVARAVHYLHQHDLIHRDLKLSNVLLDAQDEPKVSDFGLVKFVDQGQEMEMSLAQAGTPPYMAPEQTGLLNLPVSPRTDVWALGVMLYRLLTGRMPFEAAERSGLIHQICKVPCPAPRTFCPDLDRGLEVVVLKCLNKRPAERFATVAELADELRRWLDGQPLKTRPDNLWRGIRRFVRRRPVIAALLAVAAVLLLALPFVIPAVHPDRPLWDIQAELAAGQPAALIGSTGPPRWCRWISEPKGTISVNQAEPCQVECWGDWGQLELAHDLPCAHFKVRVQVRHLRGDGLGQVGLYLFHTTGQAGIVRFVSFVHLSFNDVVRQEKPNKNYPGPDLLNRVDLEPVIFYPGSAGKSGPARVGTGLKPVPLQPAGIKGGNWRDLEIEVSPVMLLATFGSERQPLHPVPVALLQQKICENIKFNFPNEPESLNVDLNPRTSVGLLVSRAAAAFRDVVIEPLE
jgi:serine/threonine-protein kinase